MTSLPVTPEGLTAGVELALPAEGPLPELPEEELLPELPEEELPAPAGVPLLPAACCCAPSGRPDLFNRSF